MSAVYRRNGKQVLCGMRHFADAADDEAARLIVEAMNGQRQAEDGRRDLVTAVKLGYTLAGGRI